MFPSNWVQCWWHTPFTNNRLPEQLCQRFFQWFDYDPAFPTGFNFVVAAFDLCTWFDVAVTPRMQNPPHNPNQKPALDVYFNVAGTVISISVGSDVAFPRGDSLPPSKGVVVRRWTSLTSNPGNARVNIPCVPVVDVQGGFLTPAAQALWEGTVSNMTNGIISQGVLFRPCVASYRDSTLLPILAVTVTPKLGLLKRRARRSDHAAHFGPKLPPL